MALHARESGIDLVYPRAGDLPDIVADKRAVKQILINLLSNAIKFTERGGKVTVTAERRGIAAGLRVRDTGVGIAEDDLRQVGDPFFQVRNAYDRTHDGTGLGLSIVKGLVELHGGEMTVQSKVDEGTRVTVACRWRSAAKARAAVQQHRDADAALRSAPGPATR